MDVRESYFRLWDRISDELTIRAKRAESEGEERELNYSYDLCDGLCLEFGI